MATGNRVRVGVLAPMKIELKSVVKAFKLQPAEINGTAVHKGVVGNAEIVATKTGIGTALAISATERLLALGDFDRVMVVGVAGSVGPSLAPGDVVIPEVVFDGEGGKEYRPTPIDGPTPRGSLVTSDDFIVDPDRLARMIANGVIAVDMETGSIATVCAQRGIPWSTVRAISDRAEDGDDEMLTMADSDGSPNPKAIARYFVRHPNRIPYMMKVGRDGMTAAKNAAVTAAAACAKL
jgi:adenosylhomocysteine nucleosidase